MNGGASKVAIDEAVALAEVGLDVTFIGAVGPACEALVNSRAKVISLDQPELLEVAKQPGVALQAIWNGAARRALSEELDGADASRTVVHLHGYTKALSVAPLKLAKARGATTLCTLHDFFAACPNGAFFDYQRGEPCGLKAMSIGCMMRNCDKRSQAHKAYRLARQAAQRWIGGFPDSVDAYITLSEFSAEKLRPYLPEGRMMRALPNIIDAVEDAPVDVTQNDAIVAVGRLDIEKGVRVLMDAARRANVNIRFVGDGPLRSEVDAHPNAEATGWIDAAGVRAELAKARCLVFPSLWYEAFGLVVEEASAMGVPSIVSGISAAAERVEHRVSGLVTPGGADDVSVAKLAEALKQMQDGGFAAQLGREAHTRFWAAPPTRSAHARSLMTIYADALDQRATDPKQE